MRVPSVRIGHPSYTTVARDTSRPAVATGTSVARALVEAAVGAPDAEAACAHQCDRKSGEQEHRLQFKSPASELVDLWEPAHACQGDRAQHVRRDEKSTDARPDSSD